MLNRTETIPWFFCWQNTPYLKRAISLMAYVNFFNTPIYKTDVPFHSSHLHFDRRRNRDRGIVDMHGVRMDTKTKKQDK